MKLLAAASGRNCKNLFFLVSIIFMGCSVSNKEYTYRICVAKPGQSSTLTNSKIIRKTQDSTAVLFGRVLEKESKYPMLYGNASVISKETKQVFGQAIDSMGYFSLEIPAGDYIFNVNYIGYSDFKKSIMLNSGDVREVEVLLGIGKGFVTYSITSDKKLNKKELTKKRLQLQNDLLDKYDSLSN